MSSLTQKKCVPCEGGMPAMTREEALRMMGVVKEWTLRQAQGDRGEHLQIEREFTFKDFKEALGFVNKVGALAEEEGHHPNIYLYGWNKVRLELYTHAIGGLHENDFVIAAKINALEPSNV